MFGERFLKPQAKEPQQTEEELEIVRKANEEADPTTYSPLPLTGNMQHTVDFDARARPHTIGVHESGEYVELRKDPKVQMAVALLAKGIVPVADVVQLQDKPEKHYSKVMPLEQIEYTTTKDELLAHLEFMYLVFGDFDHREHSGRQHNHIHKDGKAVVYDFDLTDLNAHLEGLFALRKAEHTVSSLTHLKSLLQEFYSRIDGEEGERFIESVLVHAKLSPSEMLEVGGTRTAEDIQSVLLSRTNRSMLIAENERRELLAASEAK